MIERYARAAIRWVEVSRRFIAATAKRLRPDVRQALGQLAHHRLRSALTLLGMIFGVGAVIAMIAVSEGGRREALAMIEGMGVRNLIVEADEPRGESKRDMRQHSAGLSVADALAMSDTLPFVEDWAGIRRISVWDLFSHQGEGHAEAWAVSASYFGMTQLDAGEGVLFDAADDARFAQVAVLGGNVANELFPRGGALGGLVKVNHLWLEVVAVLQDRQLPDGEFQGREVGGENDRVYLPLQTGLRRLRMGFMEAELSELKIQVADDVSPAAASEAVQHLLDRRHGGQKDTRIIIPARLLAQQKQTQWIFTIVMSAVAGISLLVGGIGIMNIMLASVMERRSEIGLLRAVGARETDVVRQFLVETAVIALLGAAAGVVLGVVMAYVIAAFAGWAVAWSLPVIALAVVVCVAIAVGFGVYPALSAARMDPVAALQSE
ncbi:MAG: ABC transporter permease [Gammaproteobacteria bacterium]|nr:ABC transporter permease [Gammaproteobacteria bacterium]